MTRIALGTVQFGLEYGIANNSGRVTLAAARGILGEAARQGLDTLDTAIAYGDSEQVLGEVGAEGWRVISKLPPIPEAIVDVGTWVSEEVAASLARLKVHHLYGLLLHRSEQLLGAQGPALSEALLDLKRQGVVGKIGISIYGPYELDRVDGAMPLDIVQAPFNILDTRMVDSGWAERLARAGVEVHARSVFLQGLLLMPEGLRPGKFDRWSDIWAVWARWLEVNQLTPLQACLRYVLSISDIEKVVVGVDSIEHLREILAATKDGRFPDPPQWPRPIERDLINPSRWSLL